jgi:hypothetical protein
MEDPAAARPAPSNGIVAEWTKDDVGKWLKEVSLGQFADEFVKRGVTGKFSWFFCISIHIYIHTPSHTFINLYNTLFTAVLCH